ncbi:MAG: glycosyltransferase [Candidatus Krumholzibacteria bacterium]|nr:glycosyltransferase [Candidatus Krumholzibacteria bacterium]
MDDRKRKKLLMLCYHYPPEVSGGVERSARFARHLGDFGWESVVLTTNRWGAEGGRGGEEVVRVGELFRRSRDRMEDRSDARAPAQRVPAAHACAGLRGAFIRFVEKWILIPDKHVRWAALAFAPALAMLRRGQADAIYTSSPPASAHVLALALRKLTGKPWIMDLRDPWTLEPLNWYLRTPGVRLSIEKRIERDCFQHADAIIANTEEAAARYRDMYPACAPRIHAIPNGYDAEELDAARSSIARDEILPGVGDGVFVMSHVGTFSRRTDEPSFPKGFFDAVASLERAGLVTKRNCRIILAGSMHPEIARAIEAYGLGELISMSGPIAREDALRIVLRSDLLLLYDSGPEAQYYIRGKLYEYIASGAYILAIIPDGATRRLLDRSGRAAAIVSDDEREIRPVLAAAIVERGRPAPRTGFDAGRYEARALTAALAGILDQVRHG